MVTRYSPPRGYAESHEFQQDYDAVTAKYPDLVELVGSLLWGIGEDPFDFGLVPGHQAEGTRVAKSDPVLIDDKEAVILRIYFVAPESGPIQIENLDIEAGDPSETDS